VSERLGKGNKTLEAGDTLIGKNRGQLINLRREREVPDTDERNGRQLARDEPRGKEKSVRSPHQWKKVSQILGQNYSIAHHVVNVNAGGKAMLMLEGNGRIRVEKKERR